MRNVLLIFGVVALVAAWLIPLAQFGHAFWAHMTMHMGVVAVAAPLLALGVAGGKFDPVPNAPKFFSPIPASIVELIVVWAWHAPHLHHVARHTTWGLVSEQATFLLTGLLMWLSALGGDSAHSGPRRAAGVIGLLLTSMHMTLLGALLALAPRALFDHAEGHASLSPLDDQHLGGAIMLLVGGISYLAGGLWLTFGLIHGTALASGAKR